MLGGTITNTVVLPRGSHRKDPVENFAPLSPMQTEIKPRQLLNTLLVVFPILCLCVVIFRAVVRNADVVYPNSETESAFLRSYTIENAIKSGIPFWSSLSGPNSAGRGCAFHQRKFQYGFAIASGNEAGVMTGVQQDLESRLSRKGSQIIREKGNPREGFQFEYATGSINGTVTVDPLVVQDATSVAGKAGLLSGQTALKLRVRISETWHKASAGCQ